VPFVGLDDELSALRDEVVRLQGENARLLRLLELTPRQARPPGPVQTGVFDGDAGPVLALRRGPNSLTACPPDVGRLFTAVPPPLVTAAQTANGPLWTESNHAGRGTMVVRMAVRQPPQDSLHQRPSPALALRPV
jgi:hypothetical protein